MSEQIHIESRPERSLGELLADLSQETSTLVREEMRLAKLEISDKASKAGKDTGMIAAGGAVAYGGFLTLLGAVVFMLVDAGFSYWGAALLVAVIACAAGAFMAWKGMEALKRLDLMPRQSIEALKGDRNESTGVRRRATG
jgi:hypothetical protein